MPETPDWGAGRVYETTITSGLVVTSGGPIPNFDVSQYQSVRIVFSPATAADSAMLVTVYDPNLNIADYHILTMINRDVLIATIECHGGSITVQNIAAVGNAQQITVIGSSVPVSQRIDTDVDVSHVALWDTGVQNMTLNSSWPLTTNDQFTQQVGGLCTVSCFLSSSAQTGELSVQSLALTTGSVLTTQTMPILTAGNLTASGGHLFGQVLVALPRGQYSFVWAERAAVNPGQCKVWVAKA